MKINNLNLLLLIILILISCSNSKVKVSSGNSFETINFPDGSFAYLNKNSSIEFEKNFAERVVFQKGEVFYEVKKGNNPFVVKTDVGEVRVLGTEFNVKETKDDIEVEVESGNVELKIGTLVNNVKKGQKAIFKHVEKNIKIANAEFKHKKWIHNLEGEFKKVGKEIVKESRQLKKESKKVSKKVNKDLKKLKREINN